MKAETCLADRSRSRWRCRLGVLGLAMTSLAAGGPAADSRPWQAPEKEGDRWEARSRPHYLRALEAWREAERFARQAGDRASLDRSRGRQASLLAAIRDARGFRALAQATGIAAAAPLSLSAPEAGAGVPAGGPLEPPAEGDLLDLARFFTAAGRQFFLDPDREARDLPMLFEALALSHRLVADHYQVQADTEYRRALALIELSAGDVPPPARAAAARLFFKLREFDSALKTLRAGGLDDPGGGALEGKDLLEQVEVIRDLAWFRGDGEAALAANRRLTGLGSKGEEQPPPVAPFPGFVAGRSAELTRAARTLLAAASALRLDARERALARAIAGMAILEAGEPALAEEVLAAVDPEALGGPWPRAQLAARIAAARERAGDYEGALESYRRAAAALADIPDSPGFKARVALNTASLLLALGDGAGAKAAAAAVLQTRGLAPELTVRARILLGDLSYFTAAATAAAERQAVEDALAAYRRAGSEIGEASAGGKITPGIAAELRAQVHIHAGNCLRRLAGIAAGSGDMEKLRREAIQSADLALRTAAEAQSPRLEAVAAANLGELHLEAGDLAPARRFSEWALERARGIHDFECEWRARWYLGRLADAAGDAAAGDREYALAAGILEERRSRIIDSEYKAGFMSTRQAFFEALVRRSLGRGDPAAAFAAAERARARAFIESLGLRFLLLAADRERQLYREYVTLLGQVEAARQEAGSLFGVTDRPSESFEELRRKVEDLRDRIRSSPEVSPAVRSLVEGSPADVPGVQRLLGEREALLEYFSTGDRLVAFAIGRRGFEAIELEVSPRRLAALVDSFLSGGLMDAAVAGDLARILIDPVEDHLRAQAAPVPAPAAGAAPGQAAGGALEVTLVPWGPLHRLPFEALRRGGRYLVEDWEIAYLPSASVLSYLPRDPAAAKAPRGLVAFVDPDTDYNGDGKPDFPRLRFAHREAEGIAKLFEEKVILEGGSAQEETCVRLAPRGEVLHLACHGEFLPSRPLDSTLYLSSGQSADGRLKAVEILGLDLRSSRLVTLSGCETGRLEVGPGDDPVGIGTAFLHSGTRALLASLWKVEDEATAALMESFYRNWIRDGGANRARALREAKRSLLRDGEFTAPRQWAAFVLNGIR